MYKLIAIIIVLVLLVKFNPFVQVDDYFKDRYDAAEAWLDKVTDPNIQAKPKNIIKHLGKQFEQYSPAQQAYIQDITATKESLRDFVKEYCKQSAVNPVLYGDRLVAVCKVAREQLALIY